LWRKAIAVYRRLCRPAGSRRESEAAQTRSFVKQIFGGKVTEPKIFPPS